MWQKIGNVYGVPQQPCSLNVGHTSDKLILRVRETTDLPESASSLVDQRGVAVRGNVQHAEEPAQAEEHRGGQGHRHRHQTRRGHGAGH